MKCPNCTAEIEKNSEFCEFCGSSITAQMRMEQEQLNKVGCPKCQSTNICFSREKQGELKGKGGTEVVRATVGMCKDCGYTWIPNSDEAKQKKNKTWLWVLGWIFIFPVPLTILMLRKKDMKPILKYGIIAIAWIIYLIIGIAGNSSESTPTSSTPEIIDNNSINITENNVKEFYITEGEKGVYGFELTLNSGTEFETTKYYYHIPSGEYTITNIGVERAQVSVLSDEITNNDAGWEEFAEVYECVAFDAGETGIICVSDNQCIEITEGSEIKFEQAKRGSIS